VIARRRAGHGSGLGRQRWVVERTLAWLHNFRRLRTRYERLAELHLAFLHLGCALIDLGCALIAHAALALSSGGYPLSSSSRESRPYWSGIQPQPQIGTGPRGRGPYSSIGSTFSAKTRQRWRQLSPRSKV